MAVGGGGGWCFHFSRSHTSYFLEGKHEAGEYEGNENNKEKDNNELLISCIIPYLAQDVF